MTDPRRLETQYTRCRFDHHGYCQEHRLRESTGIDLKCIDGIVEDLSDDALAEVEALALKLYMQGQRS